MGCYYRRQVNTKWGIHPSPPDSKSVIYRAYTNMHSLSGLPVLTQTLALLVDDTLQRVTK